MNRNPSEDEIFFASIEEVARLLRRRKISPVELTRLMLARIEKLNTKLNAYITVSVELALRQAKKAERELYGKPRRRDRGLLHGIPISLKDNICTEGVRTTSGAKFLKNFVPPKNAAVVEQLFEAGAVLLGKTNLHEFAYGVTTNNPHFGATKNPWDLRRVPGGSSGGSAAAVAAGLCFGSVGTDTGGSIRIPAALCGVAGIKPGAGRVAMDGIVPLSKTLDFAGPLARTMEDATILLAPIFARGKTEISLRKPAKSRGIHLGIPREFFLDVISPEVRTVFDEALRSLQKLGASLKDVHVPLIRETEDAGNQIAWAEATQHHRQEGWFPQRSAEYGEDVRSRLEMGNKVSVVAYLNALELRRNFIRQFHAAMEEAGVDALVAPTTPIAAPEIGREKLRIDGNEYSARALLLRLNRPANLAGVPAISVPFGFTRSGLPIGLQLIGASGSDHFLMHIARQFERANPQTKRPPL